MPAHSPVVPAGRRKSNRLREAGRVCFVTLRRFGPLRDGHKSPRRTGLQCRSRSSSAALLPNPDLLFLDEPFEGVDAVTSRVIRDLLLKIVARGSTVFLTSHVLEIVERLCTHVGIIVRGRLVEQDALEALRAGRSLEERFLEMAGSIDEMHQQLSWLDGASMPDRQEGPQRGESVPAETRPDAAEHRS